MLVNAPSPQRANGLASLVPITVGLGAAAEFAGGTLDALRSTLRTPQHWLAVYLVDGNLDLAATAGVDPWQPRSGLEVSASAVDLQLLHREIPALGALGSTPR